MAFVTYILAVALHYGLKSDFRPDILGVKASTGLFVVLLDFLFVKLGCYLLNIQVRSPLRLPFSILATISTSSNSRNTDFLSNFI